MSNPIIYIHPHQDLSYVQKVAQERINSLHTINNVEPWEEISKGITESLIISAQEFNNTSELKNIIKQQSQETNDVFELKALLRFEEFLDDETVEIIKNKIDNKIMANSWAIFYVPFSKRNDDSFIKAVEDLEEQGVQINVYAERNNPGNE